MITYVCKNCWKEMDKEEWEHFKNLCKECRNWNKNISVEEKEKGLKELKED